MIENDVLCKMSRFQDSPNLLLCDIMSLHGAVFSSDTTVEESSVRAFSGHIFDVEIFHLICHYEGIECGVRVR